MDDKEKIKLILGIINNIEPNDPRIIINKKYTSILMDKFGLFSDYDTLDIICYDIVYKYKSFFDLYEIRVAIRLHNCIEYQGKVVNWRGADGNIF